MTERLSVAVIAGKQCFPVVLRVGFFHTDDRLQSDLGARRR